MSSSPLHYLVQAILNSPLVDSNGVQFFVKRFQGPNIVLPLKPGHPVVNCDFEMSNGYGISNGVRFRILVPGQLGISVYITNVAAATPPELVRAALAKAVRYLAARPQLAMVDQDVTHVQVPVNGGFDFESL